MYFQNVVQRSIFILYNIPNIQYTVGITMNFAKTKGMSIKGFNETISAFNIKLV